MAELVLSEVTVPAVRGMNGSLSLILEAGGGLEFKSKSPADKFLDVTIPAGERWKVGITVHVEIEEA